MAELLQLLNLVAKQTEFINSLFLLYVQIFHKQKANLLMFRKTICIISYNRKISVLRSPEV